MNELINDMTAPLSLGEHIVRWLCVVVAWFFVVVLVRFAVRAHRADSASAKRGPSMVATVPVGGPVSGRVPVGTYADGRVATAASPWGSDGVPHAAGWGGGEREGKELAAVLPFLPREGFAPAEPEVTAERYPALVAAIAAEFARRSAALAGRATRVDGWPPARHVNDQELPALAIVPTEKEND